MGWSFSTTTRTALLKALSGYADPAAIVRALEGLARSYDPGRAAADIREMERSLVRQLHRVETETGHMLRALEGLSVLAHFNLVSAFEDAARHKESRDDGVKTVRFLYHSLVALRTAARKSRRPRKRGRPPAEMRRNLCEWVGFLLGISPATRARIVRGRRGDAGEWRADALTRVLPLFLADAGAMPHQRDFPPLLRHAQARLTQELLEKRQAEDSGEEGE